MPNKICDMWVMYHAWWKAKMVRFCCFLHCFIHQHPFVKPFISHTHPSFCFILLCHCPQWISVSKFHLSALSRGVTEWMRPRGETSNVGCWPWFFPPSHLYLSCWLLFLRMIWSWLSQERKKGPLPMTNDNLRINTHVREGGRKRAESLFHHLSVSVGLVINLWSLLPTLFWCLSLNFSLFIHFLTLVKL